MSYLAERDKVGRKPVTIIEIDLDKCAETYGVSPCTAALGVGEECYNTRKTCQDAANYNNTATLTLKLSDTLIDGETYLPCIESSKLTPVEISPGDSFGKRAAITVKMRDFPHHDRGIDPYASTRTSQGTFFGKMLARNPYYQGRELRLITGYIADPFSVGDLQTQTFIIEKIAGPDKDGRYTIIAKDILKLADDTRAVCPVASTGALVSNITAAATSLTVTSGTEAEYTDEYIRIGDEVILAPTANRAANVFSNLTRSTWNTEASTHDTGDAVQNCKHFDNENVIDVVNTLLTTFASISSSYITIADWQAERDIWLLAANLTTLITEPTGVKTLLDEISEQIMVYIWWDSVNKQIRLKSVAPPITPVATLSDENSFLSDPTVDIRQDDRRSRVVVHYRPRNPIDLDKISDFDSAYGKIDANAEDPDQFGDVRIEMILARWITSDAQAATTGSRHNSHHKQTPKRVTFEVDAKDSDSTIGDYVNIDSRSIPGFDGSNEVTLAQILSVEELTTKMSGTQYRYKAMVAQYASRYGRIMSSSASSTYGSATNDEKDTGCYIVGAGLTEFTDGGEGYRIV